MNVVVVGRGAIGGAYCAALAKEQGVELSVAASKERVEKYSSEGYIYNGKELELNYFTPDGDSQKADLILLTTKWDGYSDALGMIESLVGESTIILPLLNGLLPVEMAAERYPQARVLAGYYIGNTAVRSGNSTTVKGDFKTCFGEREGLNIEGKYSQTVVKVSELFEQVGLKFSVDRDMRFSQWRKFIINIGFNQVSALDGGLNYRQLNESCEMRELCQNLMYEALNLALALGIEVKSANEIVDKAMSAMEWLNGEDYTSMAQDVRAKRVTEWEIFGGYLIARAKECGVDHKHHIWLKNRLSSQGVL